MVGWEPAELLHQAARPAYRRIHRALRLSQTEEHLLAVLRKEPRSGLQQPCLASRGGLHGDSRTDGVTIALQAAQTEGDRRRRSLHHVLQQAQLRSIAVFQHHFLPSVMIEIGQGNARPSSTKSIPTTPETSENVPSGLLA